MAIEISDHNRLLVKVAHLYYEDGLTQVEISRRLRLSRQKVQRLLQSARDQGIVQISIRPIMGIIPELETNLEERFGLGEAVIVETTSYEDQDTVAREVGAGAAEYILPRAQTWGQRGDQLGRDATRDGELPFCQCASKKL